MYMYNFMQKFNPPSHISVSSEQPQLLFHIIISLRVAGAFSRDFTTNMAPQCWAFTRATIAHLRVNKYSHWTKCVFFSYMGMAAILVMFQVYGCNSFHRIIGPVNTYQRPSCHFFPCKSLCFEIDLDLN